MADEDVPADWVLLEAARRASFSKLYAVDDLRLLAKGEGAFPALCDMIAKHEHPPVDEATALFCELLRISKHALAATPDNCDQYDNGAIDHLRTYLAKVRAEAKA